DDDHRTPGRSRRGRRGRRVRHPPPAGAAAARRRPHQGAHALPRRGHRPGAGRRPLDGHARRGRRGLLRHVFQRLPRRLLAALDDAAHGAAPAGAARHRPRRRAPLQGRRHRGARHLGRGHRRRHRGAGAGPHAVHRRRLVLVRPVRGRRPHPRDGRLVRHPRARARGPAGGRHLHLQPPHRLRRRDVDDRLRPRGLRRADRRRRRGPGQQEGARRRRLRRDGRGARRPAAPGGAGQPRRQRRLRPRHVRDPRAHRRHAPALPRRRRAARSRQPAPRADLQPVHDRADARRRSDAAPAEPLGAAHHGRGRRPARVPLPPGRLRRDAARLRRGDAARDQRAAPPGRRRLQRLVDVPDPPRGAGEDRPAPPAVHQVGRRRVRPARQGGRLPHGDAARRRHLAPRLDRQGRRQRLAGLLLRPQPADRRGAAQPLRQRRRHPGQRHEGRPQAPAQAGVLGGRAAREGLRGLPGRPVLGLRRAAHGAGRRAGTAEGVPRQPGAGLRPARAGDGRRRHREPGPASGRQGRRGQGRRPRPARHGATRPGPRRPPAAAGAGAGRAVVRALHPRQRHRGHRRRSRRDLPAPRPGRLQGAAQALGRAQPGDPSALPRAVRPVPGGVGRTHLEGRLADSVRPAREV
ncbi:MAG: Bifunctional beta-1,5/1,6-galactofuranosyltransferase GlfT2 in cell wall galactan polymerization, partial [uncultured Blastococcus sp.]